MREKKYYVWFDSLDRGTMINCLNEMRNRLISEGRYTDGVDEAEALVRFQNADQAGGRDNHR